jgi:hypothetical protein
MMTTTRYKGLGAALAATLFGIAAPAGAEQAFVDPFTQANRDAANAATRIGDVPVTVTIRTDERYNKPGLFSGPRGWAYWNYLEDPKGYQNPNLWPDKRPTYMFGEMTLPAGSELTITGWFPHVRFFNFSIYLFEKGTFVNAPGGSIDGYDIEPDAGSTNPYRVGADRNAANRAFTIRLVAKAPPANPADRTKNTVYLGNADSKVFGGFRMYVSDKGYDGAGWGPGAGPSSLPPGLRWTATLADGTQLSQAEVVQRFGKVMSDAPPPIDAEKWYALVNNAANPLGMTPATAPATKDSQFFLFTGLKDALFGAFMAPAERAKIVKPKTTDSGANASTAYLVNYTSRKFGPLYVLRAKMPTFPDTWANAKTMPDGEVQYWSVATMATFTNGSLWDGVFDMQVPVDKDGYYTIVISRPEDRPKNATPQNGITWIDWGAGEGIGDPRNRKDWGAVLMRFMVPHKDWQYNPFKPGDLATVMGPYYPRGYYTSKEAFERDGARTPPAAK